jgi:LAO/AO transport system kinase
VSRPLSALAAGIVAGDRRSLARGITLVESTLAAHEAQALDLLRELVPHHRRGLRVGVSGPPGVGKSSLLEKLGMHLVRAGRRPALLVVDPTSQRGGGSILGDKTRMVELAREPAAYVRPSPSGDQRGGITRATGDVLILCEVAGFEPSLVETVGVGQAESSVTRVVDVLLLLLEPGAGDELQGIKRGLYEWGDVIAVNKSDGDRADLAERTRAEFAGALAVLHGGTHSPPPVLGVSAHTGTGIAELWTALEARHEEQRASGQLDRRRREQLEAELHQRLAGALMRRFLRDERHTLALAEIERRVRTGELLPGEAVRQLLDQD